MATLGWAAYLACSWTWCIGMFLPALLVRDFGIWSFVAFAVPNVIGAASLGWVMRSPGSSVRLLERHGVMVWVFSAVTVAFQTYFVSWVWSSAGGWWWVPAAACVAVCVIPGGVRGVWLVFAGVVWLISAVVIVRTASASGVLKPIGTGFRVDHVVPLAAVCALGFAACPYLDATFHRARIETGASSRAAFGLGFGWLFGAMILGTLLCAALLIPLSKGVLTAGAGLLVAAHVVPQVLFTVRVHAMEFRWGRVGLGLFAGVAFAAVAVLRPMPGVMAGLTTGELIYRGFMGFYGLLFPAYVLVVMLPVRIADGRRVSSCTRERAVWWVVAVVLALPFYWAAFMLRQTWAVVPGVLIVLAACAGAAGSVRRRTWLVM